MRGTDRERQRLIDRLKTIKDPRERERVLWALEGLMKDSYGATRPSPGLTQEPPAEPPAKMRLPLQIPKQLGLMTRLVVPIFFILFGLAFLIQAVLRGVETKDFASEAGQFITGGVFLLFGFSALQRVRKMGKLPGDAPDR